MKKWSKKFTIRIFLCITIMLSVMIVWTGCGQEASTPISYEDNVTLVWAANPYYFGAEELDDQIVEELNRRLREDYGCNFQVQFEWIWADGDEYQNTVYERYQNNETTDIFFTGLGYHGQEGAYDSMVKKGLLYQWDDLLEQTDYGQKLYGAFHEMFWQTMYSKDGIYGLCCANPQIYYDATLLVRAEYSSAIEDYGEVTSLWDLRNVLEQLAAENPDSLQDMSGIFVDIDSLCTLEGYTPVINGYWGLYFVEEDNSVKVINAAEDEHFLKMWQEIQYCNNISGNTLSNTEAYQSGNFVFAFLGTNLLTLYNEQLLVNTLQINVETLAQVPEALIYARNAVTSIASWSKHPEEAMELLSLIATQPELSNLLTYGIEGVHYDLVGGTVVPISSGSAYSALASPANRTITYPNGLEPENKTEIYQARNNAAVLSPEIIYGLDYTEYVAEMANISSIYEAHEGLWYGTCEDVEAEAAQLQRELEAAGVDKLVKTLNKLLGN